MTQGRIDVGGPDFGARLNQLFGSSGILTMAYSQHADRYQIKPAGQDAVLIVDSTTAPTDYGYYIGGYGGVLGSVQNNHSSRQAYAGTYTATSATTSSRSAATTRRSRRSDRATTQDAIVRACTQTGNSTCDLGQAPLWTNFQGCASPIYYEHDFYSANADPASVVRDAPFDTPTNRYSGYVQDQWRIVPTLTLNFGIRYDAESFYNGLGLVAFRLSNEWAPRFGATWDFIGDGTSKLYASAGRFYYALPTDLQARAFAPNTSQATFNYSPTNLDRVFSVCAPGDPTPGCVPSPYQVYVRHRVWRSG